MAFTRRFVILMASSRVTKEVYSTESGNNVSEGEYGMSHNLLATGQMVRISHDLGLSLSEKTRSGTERSSQGKVSIVYAVFFFFSYYPPPAVS